MFIVSGFNISGYLTEIVINKVGNVFIINNIINECENGIDVANSVVAIINSHMIVVFDASNGIYISNSNNVNSTGNNLTDFSARVSVSESNNTNISGNTISNIDSVTLESDINVS